MRESPYREILGNMMLLIMRRKTAFIESFTLPPGPLIGALWGDSALQVMYWDSEEFGRIGFPFSVLERACDRMGPKVSNLFLAVGPRNQAR